MQRLLLAASLLAITVAIGDAAAQRAPRRPVQTGDIVDVRDRTLAPAAPIARHCPPDAPHVFEIREANPAVNRGHHNLMRARLAEELRKPNTTVRLGPNVVLDFAGAGDLLPLTFGPCVTLESVDSFKPDLVAQARIVEAAPVAGAGPVAGTTRRAALRAPLGAIIGGQAAGSARTPHSQGPVLRFGRHTENDEPVFLAISCAAGVAPNDHVRISGFRVEGPSLGQQTADQFGILIHRCLDIEISNMEIYGWGAAGVRVLDDEGQGPGQEPPANREGERIGRPEQVRIFNNYFHHNQHESECDSSGTTCIIDEHAAGYGVDVHHGAWAQIYFNLFDVNRHAIAASGRAGGYDARWNLVLKGGGYHGRTFNEYTHQFDIHGTDSAGLGGQAGVQSWFYENSFQYLNGPAIKIRGRPHIGVYIGRNVFAHEGLEDDWGDDAIHLDDRSDLDVIKLESGNVINFDSYGRYGVCDFDGDRIDDLFLATGKTWWFSSFGEFPWSYLTARIERLDQVRLGYFDNDQRCDVLTQSGADWVIASGGTGAWQSIGRFSAPLSEVVFGQFDPNRRDHRAGATRRATHAFRRMPNGEWRITPLAAPNWQAVGSSSYPMSDLRFGDFTGDGVTDVLGLNSGRWAISESARGLWRNLNPNIGDDVTNLFIADLNNNNIDDIIKLDVTPAAGSVRVRWLVSDDGRTRWRELRSYVVPATGASAVRAFAGRFGVAPGGGVLLVDHTRTGRFFSEAERARGASPDWSSLFQY